MRSKMDICQGRCQVAVQEAVTLLQFFSLYTGNTVYYTPKILAHIAIHIRPNSTSSKLGKMSCRIWNKRNGHLPLWQCCRPWACYPAFCLNNTGIYISKGPACALTPGKLENLSLSTSASDWLADCLWWIPISVNRGTQRTLKMGLALLEHLPVAVPRNM
jgi:hypothetical protein